MEGFFNAIMVLVYILLIVGAIGAIGVIIAIIVKLLGKIIVIIVKSYRKKSPGDSDLLEDPETAYLGLGEKYYKAELELVDRYKSFVAEILRLSVLGIAVFGFLYNEIFKYSSRTQNNGALELAILGLIMFAISAVSALFFQYFSSEGFRWYIVGLRHYLKSSPKPATFDERNSAASALNNKRDRNIIFCVVTKILTSFALGIGALLMAFSLILSFLSLNNPQKSVKNIKTISSPCCSSLRPQIADRKDDLLKQAKDDAKTKGGTTQGNIEDLGSRN